MKVLVFLFGCLAAATSAHNTLRGSDQQEELYLQDGEDRGLKGKRISAVGPIDVVWELKLNFSFNEEFESLRLCKDPYRPSDTTAEIPLWDFMRVRAEQLAGSYLDDFAASSLLEIDPSSLLWSLDSTLTSSGPTDRRRLYSFTFRTGGHCTFCDPEKGDARRKLGDSNAHTVSKLSDYVARGIKHSIEDHCDMVAQQVTFDRVA